VLHRELPNSSQIRGLAVASDHRNGTITPKNMLAQTAAGKRKPRRPGRDKAQFLRFLQTISKHGEVDAPEQGFESALRALLRPRARHLLALAAGVFGYLAIRLTID
jgi:hypothetical protein